VVDQLKIKFNMKIHHNNEKQVVDFTTDAKRYFKNDAMYLMFEEPVMEINGVNRTTCILHPDKMKIIRKGSIEMNQVFQVHEDTFSFYKTQYGTLEMKVKTNFYYYNKDCVLLKYDMRLGENQIGHYDLEIQIKGAETIE
jgi:uncharacterized beta-barrel protein YwiB (DUF1934 family)